MRLTKIEIQNYRLLIDANLKVDTNTTLIVGRNNTAKTSCMDFLYKVLNDKKLSYNDYPLLKRKLAFIILAKFMKGTYSFEQLIAKIPKPSIRFFVDYSQESEEENLGALSPFIIDVDENISNAIILAEYTIKLSEDKIKELFKKHIQFDEKGNLLFNKQDIRELVSANFSTIFILEIKAINPCNDNDAQSKSSNDLKELFPLYTISAERDLDESGNASSSSLQKVISNYFNVNMDDVDASIADKVKELRDKIENINCEIQRETDTLLSEIVNKTIGFGYPNAEELKLGVSTSISLRNEIQNNSALHYVQKDSDEILPSNYNGLGYKNLIKIQFQLAQFADEIKHNNWACIPLLFIEEPESHMHPQMQQTFISYLESFLQKISEVHIQTFITSHSSHIANTIDFSKIRYAQKSPKGVKFKDLGTFTLTDGENLDFVKKYITLSRCDLFFADKAIFIEGASERLLIPDMIKKCERNGLFNFQECKLSAQYYALIEVGGAYAYKFIPFIEFLGIPSLIITDIDSILDKKTCLVSQGETTSNETIKYFLRKIKNLKESDKITLTEIMSLNHNQKTIGKVHIEYQISENNLCGRSLEESIRNVNRKIYGLSDTAQEESLKFEDKSKTEFALNLLFKNTEYNVPKYIEDGLVWLNNQKVLI